MTSGHPISRSPDVPICTIAPLDVWIAIKTVLRRELGEREWEMWIQHARLWRVMAEGDREQTLGVLMPRNGRAIFGVNRYIKRVRQLAAKMMYGILIAPATDPEQHQLSREAYEGLDDDDPRKTELLEKWEMQHIWLSHPFLEEPCSLLWEKVSG
jgi:hypothetical protein